MRMADRNMEQAKQIAELKTQVDDAKKASAANTLKHSASKESAATPGEVERLKKGYSRPRMQKYELLKAQKEQQQQQPASSTNGVSKTSSFANGGRARAGPESSDASSEQIKELNDNLAAQSAARKKQEAQIKALNAKLEKQKRLYKVKANNCDHNIHEPPRKLELKLPGYVYEKDAGVGRQNWSSHHHQH